jgi:hypothetical protein
MPEPDTSPAGSRCARTARPDRVPCVVDQPAVHPVVTVPGGAGPVATNPAVVDRPAAGAPFESLFVTVNAVPDNVKVPDHELLNVTADFRSAVAVHELVADEPAVTVREPWYPVPHSY